MINTNTNKHDTTAPFKVGDIVCGIYNNGYIVTNERMKKAEVIRTYADGMTIKILEHEDYNEISNTFPVRNTDKEFKLVKQNTNKSINITTDGVTTTAVFKDGKKVIEQSSTKCHPLDKFDFNIGSRIAFDRLMDKVTPLRLMHGDEVLGVIGDPTGKTDSFGSELHVGDLVTNVILGDENRPMRSFAKAICINKDELANISKSLNGKDFDVNGVIALTSSYSNLTKMGRGYKINDDIEIR